MPRSVRPSANAIKRHRHVVLDCPASVMRRAVLMPVAKAVWFIETHFAEAIDFDAVAGVAGVSRFHLTRMFGLATGSSVIRYVRGRRLTEAARALAGGARETSSLWRSMRATARTRPSRAPS